MRASTVTLRSRKVTGSTDPIIGNGGGSAADHHEGDDRRLQPHKAAKHQPEDPPATTI